MAQNSILDDFFESLGGIVQAAAGQALSTLGDELSQKSAAQNAETESALQTSLGTVGQAVGKGFTSEAMKYIVIFVVIILLVFTLFVRRR